MSGQPAAHPCMRSERIGGRRTGRIEVMHGDPPDRIHKMLSIPFRRTLDTRAVRSPQLLQNGKFHQLGPFIALASQSDPKLKIASRRYPCRIPACTASSISPAVWCLGHSPYSAGTHTFVFFGLPRATVRSRGGQFEWAPGNSHTFG